MKARAARPCWCRPGWLRRAGLFQEECDFRRVRRRIVIFEARDLLEQIGTPFAIQPAAWDRLLKAGQSLHNVGSKRGLWSLWESVAVRSCIDARFRQRPKRECGAPRAAKTSLRIAPRIHHPSPFVQTYGSRRLSQRWPAKGTDRDWRMASSKYCATRWEKSDRRSAPSCLPTPPGTPSTGRSSMAD